MIIMKTTLSLLTALVVMWTASVSAQVNVHGDLPMPASLFTEATVDACENNPGPFITMGGDITLGGINGRLIFRNNAKGTHTHDEDVTVDVELLKNGEQIQFAKQPSQGGVGGNPWIYVQFFTDTGEALSSEILLGRCVQGLSPTALGFVLATAADVSVEGGSCSNHPGTNITLSGEMRLSGINATVTFRNNQKGTHEYSEDDVTVDVVILPAGDTISFAKQPPEGGVGGNPLVYFQFLDGDGNALGGEVFLGRCNKL